jgi:hypothetical protein
VFGSGNNNWLPWALLEDEERRNRAALRKAERAEKSTGPYTGYVPLRIRLQRWRDQKLCQKINKQLREANRKAK